MLLTAAGAEDPAAAAQAQPGRGASRHGGRLPGPGSAHHVHLHGALAARVAPGCARRQGGRPPSRFLQQPQAVQRGHYARQGAAGGAGTPCRAHGGARRCRVLSTILMFSCEGS